MQNFFWFNEMDATNKMSAGAAISVEKRTDEQVMMIRPIVMNKNYAA